MTSKNRTVILIAAKSALSLVILLLLTIILHEGAHFVTALMLGVPVAYFTWFDSHYFAPVFISGAKEHTMGMAIVGYAGGLVTGVLLLAILVLKRGWFKQSLYRWLLGFYLATFGFWEICQGILEGAFHDMYIADVTNILSLSHCVGYASAVLGMGLYWILMRGFKELAVR